MLKPFKNKRPICAENVYIADSAVVIGDVVMGSDVSVWPTTVIRGDVEKIRIGSGTNIQDGSVLHVTHAGDYATQGQSLHIGKGVTIGHRAVVHACTVGNYCLIGIGAIILDGAILDDYVLLGAGALVPQGKKLVGGCLYMGTPARQVRALTASEKQFLEYSYQHYIHLKNDYLTNKH